MTARIRAIVRALAFVLYLLCYTIVGIVGVWIAGLILLTAVRFKTQGHPWDDLLFWTMWGAGLVLGLFVAWRSRANRIAHWSMIAFGGVNALAGLVMADWYRNQALSPSGGIGEAIAAVLLYYFAALGGVSLLGGFFGLVYASQVSPANRQLATSGFRPPAS